jgi:hypothetical protein
MICTPTLELLPVGLRLGLGQARGL